MNAYVSVAEILAQLDACLEDWTFPALDNGYVYLVDTRLHAFADATRWAMIIEVVGYSPRASGLDCILYVFGNCLSRPPGTANEDFIRRIDCTDVESDLVPEHAREGLDAVEIGGVRIALPEHIDPWPLIDLFRSLTPAHRDVLLATERELHARLPDDLPRLLRLQAWRHPDVTRGEKPSQSETFIEIARVLVSEDATQYAPPTFPNTHWSKWPESGSL